LADFYERLLNFTRDGVYRYTVDEGRLVLANQGFVDLLDLDITPDQVTGRLMRELLVYTEPEGHIRELLSREREIHGYEYHFKTVKGDDRWVVHDSFIATDPNTGKRVVDCIVKDITEQKRVQMRLRNQRNLVSTILNIAGALVVVLDREGKIERFNRACERATGYSFDDVRGRTFAEVLLPEEEQQAVMDIFARLRAGEFPIRHENHWLTKEGRERLISWSNTALVNELGEVAYLIGTGIDVTEHRAAEMALRRAHDALAAERAMLQAVLDQTPVGLMAAEAASGRFLFVNERMREIWRDPEFHAGSVAEYAEYSRFHVSGAPISLEEMPLWRALAEGEAITEEEQDFLRGDETRGTLSVNAAPVRDAEGQVIAAVAALTDVTERKAAERALREARDELELRVQERTAELSAANERLREEVLERQRAEDRISQQAAELSRSNTELQQFAYVASHDLQEPLRKIQAFGGRLEAKSAAKLDEESSEYLTRMQDAASRMSGLITDLLNYSRVTTRAKDFEQVDLGAIALEVISDLEVTIEQAGATVEVGELLRLEADPVQMRQLLQNLIANGLKFRREGIAPVVKVTAELLPAEGAEADGGLVQLAIADNGIGFEEKYLDRIFGLFQRLHARHEYAGTGIGLAICRKIAERHGGTITARSTPGQGSTFLVTLQLEQKKGGLTHDGEREDGSNPGS
jgi:PAS domain S-box-containing protein